MGCGPLFLPGLFAKGGGGGNDRPAGTETVTKSRIKFIFFDVGNTLLFPNRQRIHAPLAERGIVDNPEHLRDLECRTKNQFDGMMTKSGSTDHSFWWMFYSHLLREIGMEDDAIRDQ